MKIRSREDFCNVGRDYLLARMARIVRRNGWARILLLSGFLLFDAIFIHQHRYASATPVSRLDALHAVILEGSFAINEYETNTPDKAWKSVEAGWYSDKAPGAMVLALPAFAAAAGVVKLAGGGPGFEDRLVDNQLGGVCVLAGLAGDPGRGGLVYLAQPLRATARRVGHRAGAHAGQPAAAVQHAALQPCAGDWVDRDCGVGGGDV